MKQLYAFIQGEDHPKSGFSATHVDTPVARKGIDIVPENALCNSDPQLQGGVLSLRGMRCGQIGNGS